MDDHKKVQCCLFHKSFVVVVVVFGFFQLVGASQLLLPAEAQTFLSHTWKLEYDLQQSAHCIVMCALSFRTERTLLYIFGSMLHDRHVILKQMCIPRRPIPKGDTLSCRLYKLSN